MNFENIPLDAPTAGQDNPIIEPIEIINPFIEKREQSIGPVSAPAKSNRVSITDPMWQDVVEIECAFPELARNKLKKELADSNGDMYCKITGLYLGNIKVKIKRNPRYPRGECMHFVHGKKNAAWGMYVHAYVHFIDHLSYAVKFGNYKYMNHEICGLHIIEPVSDKGILAITNLSIKDNDGAIARFFKTQDILGFPEYWESSGMYLSTLNKLQSSRNKKLKNLEV